MTCICMRSSTGLRSFRGRSRVTPGKHYKGETMKTSDKIEKLSAAFAAAQAGFKHAKLDGVNPHFENRFATLRSIHEAIRVPMHKAGLAWLQAVSDEGGRVVLTTRIVHSSGQWLETEVTAAPGKGGVQGLGSAVSYLRRYSLAALVGVAAGDDDDGEQTDHGEPEPAPKPKPKPKPKQNDEASAFRTYWFGRLKGVADAIEAEQTANDAEPLTRIDRDDAVRHRLQAMLFGSERLGGMTAGDRKLHRGKLEDTDTSYLVHVARGCYPAHQLGD